MSNKSAAWVHLYPMDDVQHVIGFRRFQRNNGVQTRNQTVARGEEDELMIGKGDIRLADLS